MIRLFKEAMFIRPDTVPPASWWRHKIYWAFFWCCILLTVVAAAAGCNNLPQPPQPPINPPPPVVQPYPEYLQQLLDEHNQYRGQAGLKILTQHPMLDRAAQKHAVWMAANDKMSHLGEGGTSFWDRVMFEGYHGKGGGENIAAGYETPISVFAGWKRSPGHNSNILNPNWEHIGLGMSKASGGRRYWCAVFGFGYTDLTGVRRLYTSPLILELPEGLEGDESAAAVRVATAADVPQSMLVNGVVITKHGEHWQYASGVVATFRELGDGTVLLEPTVVTLDGHEQTYDPYTGRWEATDVKLHGPPVAPKPVKETKPDDTTGADVDSKGLFSPDSRAPLLGGAKEGD